MLLLNLLGNLMIKRQTVTACNSRWRKRKSSAIRTLVAETLVLAKTHGYVEKIEDELERELARDISDLPQEKIQRWRLEGDKIFKSKHVLITVVILCILDCALVLGELALDLYKVKGTLEFTDGITKSTLAFMQHLKTLCPLLLNLSTYEIFNHILESTVIFSSSDSNTYTEYSNASFWMSIPCKNINKTLSQNLGQNLNPGLTDNLSVISSENDTVAQDNWTSKTSLIVPSFGDGKEDYNLYIVEKIAHVFHYCSIAILGIIMIETTLKAVCAGRAFFNRKLEVFDAFIVFMSFVVDFMFIVIFPDIDTKDFVFILAILLPWRVIRVVNSLVVSVKDHEHFRLKLVYKRKKKIQNNLRETEAMLQKYMCQVTTLQRLCIMEGIDEWKIDNYLKNDEMPATPSKRKFKFKLDDNFLAPGQTRAPRCSLPSLDFHGLKLPSQSNVSRSRISLPSVANTIRQHLSKSSRRASMAAIELYNTKLSNGDLKKKKNASEDLTTMHEENVDDDTRDSALSSHGSIESGDVFGRSSISESIDSDRQVSDYKSRTRHDSEISDKEDRLKITQIQENAKRRHSESILDNDKVPFSVRGLSKDVVTFTNPSGKTFTRPKLPSVSSKVDLEVVTQNYDKISEESINTRSIQRIDEGNHKSNKSVDEIKQDGNSVIQDTVSDSSEIKETTDGSVSHVNNGHVTGNGHVIEGGSVSGRNVIQTMGETRIIIEDMSDDRHMCNGVSNGVSNGNSAEKWV